MAKTLIFPAGSSLSPRAPVDPLNRDDSINGDHRSIKLLAQRLSVSSNHLDSGPQRTGSLRKKAAAFSIPSGEDDDNDSPSR